MLKNKRLFSNYLLSYFIIILISLLISILVYSASVDVIRSEIVKGHNNSLDQVKGIIDNRLRALDDLYVQIGFDDEIKLMMSKTGDIEPVELLSLVKKRESLYRYRLANPDLDTIYLYFDRTGLIMTNDGIYETDVFYESVFPYEPDVFKSWLEGEDNGLVTFCYDGLGSVHTGMAYIRQLPYARTKNVLGKLIVVVDEEAIRQTLEQMKWIPEARLFILDEDSRIVTGEWEQSGPLSASEPLTAETLTILEKDYVVSRVESEYCDWSYLSVIPSDVFYARARRVKNIVILTLAAFVVVGLAVSYHFARRYYHPLDKLIEYIQANVKESVNRDRDQDEYHFIMNILDSIIAEKESYLEKESRQREKLINDFYVGLLKGGMDGKAIEELKSLYGIDLSPDDQYQVVLLSVDESNAPMLSGDADRQTDYANMIKLVYDSVLAKLIGEKYNHTFVKLEGDVACLIRVDRSRIHSAMEDMRAIMAQACDMIENRFHIGFTASAGEYHTGYGGIARSCHEAREGMEYCVLTGTRKVAFIGDIQCENRRIDDLSYKNDVEHFTQQLMAGDLTSARKIMDRIFRNRLLDGGQPTNLIKLRMNVLIHSFLAATGEFRHSGQESVQYLRTTDRLTGAKTITELHAIMNRMLDEYARCLSPEHDAEQSLHQKVLIYIHDHYPSPELNITAIADALEVSVPYLSKHFKKKMGVGPLEYLQLIRIERAKQLLINNPDCIKDIAERVGFINSISFIRVFKKYEGITPGIYRSRQ